MQKDEIKIRGLYTNPNNFSEVPQGALSVADNVVINRESVLQTRNGHGLYNTELSEAISKLFVYRKGLILSYGDKLAYDSNGTWVDYAGTYIAPEGYKINSAESNRNFYFTTANGIYKLDAYNSGTNPIPAGAPPALDGSAVLNSAPTGTATNPQNQYAYRIVWGYKDKNNNLILSAPSQRIIVINNDAVQQRNVDITFTIPVGIDKEWFYQLYRSGASGGVTIEPDDELQLVYEDNPTQTEINNLEITVTDVTPNDLRGVSLYTSPSQQGISNANYQPPFATSMTVFKNQLFYANCKSKARSTVKLISVDGPSFGYVSKDCNTDSTTTTTTINASNTDGIRVGMRVVGNNFAANTFVTSIVDSTHFTTNIPATSSGNTTLELQDYFAIDNLKLFCGSTQNNNTNTFELVNSGSVGFNIGSTALNLVKLINNSTTNNKFYALYQSGYNDLPGKILIEERVFSDNIFNMTSSNGRSFSPILSLQNNFTTTAGATTIITSDNHGLSNGDFIYISAIDTDEIPKDFYEVTVINTNTFTIDLETITNTSGYWVNDNEAILSDNDQKINRIYISKPQQPEAVPLLNYIDVGSADEPIIKVVALRDSVFIFKREAIYRLSGDNPSNFFVDVLDNTVSVRSSETITPFNNQVFAFSNQGIIAVSDSGVAVMSRPIENTLLELSSESYTNFDSASFAVSFESDRQYMFFTVSEEEDTFATQAFVFNAFTNSWTRWVMNRTCGVINTKDNKLYMGNPVNNFIYKERKEFNTFDYADESYPLVITNINEDIITVDDVTSVEVGYSLRQGDYYALITHIDGNDLTINLNPSHRWVNGDAEVYIPIQTEIRFQPNTTGAIGQMKHFREMEFVFLDAGFTEAEAIFSTNFRPVPVVQELTPRKFGSWGSFPLGTLPWGGISGGQQVIRVLIPRESARAVWLNTGIKLEESFTSFSLAGYSLLYEVTGERHK